MRRKIYDRLVEWKRQTAGRRALLIDGARRVGKSFIAEEFGKNEYRSYVLIDFSRAPKIVKDLFWNYLEKQSLPTFFLKLSEHYDVQLHKRNTLFIFDEVQAFPRAREAIKALVADGQYDYLETGSLVSIDENVTDIVIPSEEDRIKMFPMDFEEYLWATGRESLMDFIKDHYAKKDPCGPLLHRKAMDAFREYLVVGGMPQAVQSFVDTRSLTDVDRVKRSILKLYREDIEKHAGRKARKIQLIFDGIPSQLSKHEKKFRLTALEADAKMRTYEDSFLWLREAMIANICFNATEPSVGLAMSTDHTTLKCYLLDTGLLVSLAFPLRTLVAEQIHKRILLDALEFNSGMLMENIVAQMLAASGHELLFYSRNDPKTRAERMEIDFLLTKPQLTRRKNIIPVEVKSSRKYSHASLDKFTRKFKSQLDTPIVLHTKDLNLTNGITYLPLYMAPCL